MFTVLSLINHTPPLPPTELLNFRLFDLCISYTSVLDMLIEIYLLCAVSDKSVWCILRSNYNAFYFSSMLPNYSVIFVVLFHYHKWLDSDKIYKEVKTKFTLRYHYWSDPIKYTQHNIYTYVNQVWTIYTCKSYTPSVRKCRQIKRSHSVYFRFEWNGCIDGERLEPNQRDYNDMSNLLWNL